MKTAFKVIGTIIVVLLLVCVVTVFIFTKAVDPNSFKNTIDQRVYEKTGRHLVIGNVGWSFFPWLGVDLKQVQLSNPSNFSGPNLANINEVRVKVRFWPLLTGKVQLGKIVIHQAQINLITNKNGVSNWQDWQKSPAKAEPSAPAPATATESKATANWQSFKIAGIDIANSTISLINQKTNTTTTLRDFDFTTTPIAAADFFAVGMRFTLQSDAMTIPTQLTAQGKIDPQQQTFQANDLNVTATIKRPQLPSLPVSLSGNILANLKQQTLTLNSFNARLANLDLAGNLAITHFLQTPAITTTLSTKNVALEPLLTTLRGKSFIKGNLSFTATLSTSGETQQQLTQNLNGKGNIAITNGAILGFNLSHLLAQGQALLDRQPPPSSPSTSETSFSHVTGTYTIRQGMLYNEDLSLLGGEISATGKGRINLVDHTISYLLTTQYAKQKANQQPLVVPVAITGNLYSPKISPDLSGFARKILTNTIKQNIEKFGGGIGKKLHLEKLFH